MTRFWAKFTVLACVVALVTCCGSAIAAPGGIPTAVQTTFNSGGSETVAGDAVHRASIGGMSQHMHSSDGRVQNFSGALRTHVWRPDLDADADGVADETDADNDNDGLTDRDELRGDSAAGRGVTDLGSADTDGDGLGDGQEVLSGTDPLDPASQLRISEIVTTPSGHVRLSWIGHPDWTYRVKRAAAVSESGPASAADVPGAFQREAGGLGTTRFIFEDDEPDSRARFYSVEIEEK